MRRVSGIVRAVAVGFGLGVMLLVAGLGVILVVVPKATGSTPLSVLTSSMEPTLPPGTLVVVRPEDPSRIRVGDIATYQLASGRPEVVTHRVRAVTTTSTGERLFTFRGDANDVADAPVAAIQLRGVAWYSVPLLGRANTLVNGHDRPWIMPGIAGVLLVYGLAMVALGVRAARRRRRGPAAGRRSAHGRRRLTAAS